MRKKFAAKFCSAEMFKMCWAVHNILTVRWRTFISSVCLIINMPNFLLPHLDLRKKLAETYCVVHSWSSLCLVFLVRPVFGRGGKLSQSIFSCIPGCCVVTFLESMWGSSEKVPLLFMMTEGCSAYDTTLLLEWSKPAMRKQQGKLTVSLYGRRCLAEPYGQQKTLAILDNAERTFRPPRVLVTFS